MSGAPARWEHITPAPSNSHTRSAHRPRASAPPPRRYHRLADTETPRHEQDQTHSLVRQLQTLLPGIWVWLDVDCLTDVSALEESVSETAVVGIFLSLGYFRSANCRHALATPHDVRAPPCVEVGI